MTSNADDDDHGEDDNYHDNDYDEDDHDDDDLDNDDDEDDDLDWMLDNSALRCQFVPIAGPSSFLIDTTHKHVALKLYSPKKHCCPKTVQSKKTLLP